MTLIKSISGIRGTLENIPGQSLSDYDIEQFTLAYYQEIISPQSKKVIVIGRDARKSGPHIVGIVTDVLVRNGCDIIDLGLVTTPTLGVYTNKINASGGIMVSASHNDDKWNALNILIQNASTVGALDFKILDNNNNKFRKITLRKN